MREFILKTCNCKSKTCFTDEETAKTLLFKAYLAGFETSHYNFNGEAYEDDGKRIEDKALLEEKFFKWFNGD